MIIRYPTGLYNPFGRLSNFDNVTWHISSEDPPRSNDVIIKIPIAEELKNLPGVAYERKQRREAFGELIFTINESNRTMTGSATKLYGEGDVLEFQNDDRQDLVMPRGDRVESRHNLNDLDLSSVGLEADDIEQFNLSIYDKKSELERQFLDVRSEISDLETQIQEVQKHINETNKALNAVKVLEDDQLESKILDKRNQYQEQHDDLVNEHTSKSDDLASIVDNLNRIDMVAK